MNNLISVDLEDWYTSAFLRDYVKEKDPKPLIEEASASILSLFEKYDVRATFFVLGIIVQRHPELIQKIYDRGHEISSHGYDHKPLWELDKKSFSEQVIKTNRLISNITKEKVLGYRAPYFSLSRKTSWAADIIQKNFRYDSSVFPLKTMLYGEPCAPKYPYNPSKGDFFKADSDKLDIKKFIEFPQTICSFFGLKLPCNGGFYNRLYPSMLNKMLIKKFNKTGMPFMFYFHPWETYPNLPRLNVPFKNKFITYYNNSVYLRKIESMLKSFKFNAFSDVLYG